MFSWEHRAEGVFISASRLKGLRFLFATALVAIAVCVVALSSAGAAPSACSEGQKPTASSDGTTVFGSACSDTIVVTSPLVLRVYGGDGNDLIYADSNVEEVIGGNGDDVIYGEQSGPEEAPGIPYVPAPIYTPAPESESETGASASAYEEINCTEKLQKAKFVMADLVARN